MPDEPFTPVTGGGAAGTTPAAASSVSGKGPQPRSRARLPLRILAADDVRTNRGLIRLLMAHCGYEAEIVENGAEVLAALGRSSFDLILLDVQMPVMGGLEAAREIVRLHPEPGQRPRILALTANASADDRKACLAAGMDDCLSKPISLTAFRASIDRLFSEPPPDHAPASLTRQDTTGLPPVVDFAQLDAAIPGLSRPQLTAMYRRMHRAAASDFEAIWPRVLEAVSSRDQGRLAGELHALKGCFSTLGWSRIAGHCAAAMQRARAQQFAEWSTLPDELRQLYAASTAEMTRYLAAIASGESGAPAPDDENPADH